MFLLFLVADIQIILVKCTGFLHEKIIYFVLSAFIQIRFLLFNGLINFYVA